MRPDQQNADILSWPPIGGDFGLDWSELGAEKTRSSLFAAGRDALAAIVRQQPATRGRWLVPEFICPVVPDTLRACGLSVQPYGWVTPWRVDTCSLERHLAG